MFSEYNLPMQSSSLGKSSRFVVFSLLISVFLIPANAQMAAKSTPRSSASDAQKGMTLAQSGHCSEALPLLERVMHASGTDRDELKRMGLAGVHCAMTHGKPYESLAFLQVLSRDFPGDPEVLYTAAHAFSDLSLLSSQTLARDAPFSYQVHLLNAEALELQGKWDDAAAEYRKIIEINPVLPGVHARLGRALLAKPQPSPEAVAEAKKAFEQELEVNPRDASSEYVLGELARTDSDFSNAVVHYTRATSFDSGFAEAYLGLGMSLVSSKRFSDAIAPLEKYEKMAPESPTGHYELALAYAGVGRRDDANREAALQRDSAASLEKVKRRVAEGLETKSGDPSAASSPK